MAVSKNRCGATARPTLLIDYLLFLQTTNYYNKSSFYFPRVISICFLKRSSSMLGKSLLKWTPRLSCRIWAQRAISRQTVSIFWHSQPAGESKILSITYRCQNLIISWASVSGLAFRVMPTFRHIRARREFLTSVVSNRVRSECGI